MAETLHNFSAAVEKLISINRDAEQGFRAAADAVGDTELKRMFVQLSTQRAGFASEIQESVRKLGFEPANPLGTAGTLHGVWISLKGAFVNNKAHSALEEAESGEDQALNAYREALAVILQSDLRSVVERQLAAIQESHARIRTLRDQTAPPPPAPSADTKP
jgi:uncharacterized protein (TIGR02284 family)